MDSFIKHEEQERSLFPRRIVEVESEEQVRPSLRLVRGRFSHAKDRVTTGRVKLLYIGAGCPENVQSTGHLLPL